MRTFRKRKHLPETPASRTAGRGSAARLRSTFLPGRRAFVPYPGQVSLGSCWQVTPAEARAIQQRLAFRVEDLDRLGSVDRVAGVDVHFPRPGLSRAAVVVLDAATLETCDQAVAEIPTSFPYVPGLLSFREIPAAVEAFRLLRLRPDLVICDGHGRAHPRRFGLACHLGLLLDLPSIGAAKSRLVGSHRPVAEPRGATSPLIDAGEVIGTVLRSRAGVRPLYVSVGHRVGLATAVAWVLRCCPRFRLPETTRLAHRLASRLASTSDQ